MNYLETIARANTEARLFNEDIQASFNREWIIREYNSNMSLYKKPRTCFIPGCSSKTIGCHTIQNSGPIQHISEAGHVVSPKFMPHRNHEILKIGIHDASKAPMFCSMHDSTIFGVFERNRLGPQTDEDIDLQIARSIIREYIHLSHKMSFMPGLMTKTIKDYDRKVSAIATEEHRKVGAISRNQKINASPIYPEMKKKLKETIDAHEECLRILTGIIQPSTDILTNRTQSIIKKFVSRIPISLPYTFSCYFSFGSIRVTNGVKSNSVQHCIAIMIAMPSATETKFIIATHQNMLGQLNSMLKEKGLTPNPSSPDEYDRWITFIEQVMVSSTDHYFIRPSAYDALSQDEKDRLLLMLRIRGAMHLEYPTRIFS